MDLFDTSFVDLWKELNDYGVRYILVGGIAINFHGYQRFTGDMDLWIDDTLHNRKNLRKAYNAYCNIDFESFETIQFIPGWVEFPLNNGARLDILTSMKGIDISFDECYTMARKAMVSKVEVPVLHINHLIANKKIVAHPKDLLDVIQLEKIQKLREEENL